MAAFCRARRAGGWSRVPRSGVVGQISMVSLRMTSQRRPRFAAAQPERVGCRSVREQQRAGGSDISLLAAPKS